MVLKNGHVCKLSIMRHHRFRIDTMNYKLLLCMQHTRGKPSRLSVCPRPTRPDIPADTWRGRGGVTLLYALLLTVLSTVLTSVNSSLSFMHVMHATMKNATPFWFCFVAHKLNCLIISSGLIILSVSEIPKYPKPLVHYLWVEF